ncbi:MAG: triose-phosphate isomerase [Gammaproteobacteria bacterium]
MSINQNSLSSAVHPRKILIANWKLHGSGSHVERWVQAVQTLEEIRSGQMQVILCPPAIWLERARGYVQGERLALGVQNVSAQSEGSFTGEISAAMAFEAGARYALVGHSERRRLFGETDQMVAAKVEQSAQAGLIPIVCIGETAEEKRAGQTEPVLARQLECLGALHGEPVSTLWIAYEPIWSIGTGIPAEAGNILAVAAFIRAHVASSDATMRNQFRLFYGGSVGAGNAAALGTLEGVDGFLVGGASVEADSMVALCRALV